MVVFLPGQNEMEIILQRRDAGHPHLEKFFDQLGVRGDKFLRPARFDRVFTDVAFNPAAPCRDTWPEECLGRPDAPRRWKRGCAF